MLIWLTVPLGAWMMVRADYRRYNAECQEQRGECKTRAGIISRYSRDMRRLADEIVAWDNTEEFNDWRERWYDLKRELETEKKSVPDGIPSHFPNAGQTLLASMDLLSKQIAAVEDAMRSRDDYIRLGNSILQLLDDREQLRNAASYFRYVNEEQIYMQLLDKLASCEAAIDERRRQHEMLGQELSRSLLDADSYSNEIQTALQALSGKLTTDEKLTYKAYLAERFSRFNLVDELVRAISGRLNGRTRVQRIV